MKSSTPNRTTKLSLPRHSAGWTAIGACVILGAALFGALAASLIFSTSTLSESLPWIIVTVMLIPMGFAVTTWIKLNDLHAEPEGLSRDENRRLSGIVDEKLRQVYIGIAFYIGSVLFTLFVIFVGDKNPSLLAWGVPVIGGLLAISLTSVGFLLAQIREVSKFVGTLKRRKESRKSKEKLRKRTGRAQPN